MENVKIQQELDDEIEIDLRDLLVSLKDHWWIILIGTIVGAVISITVTIFAIEPKYTATSMVYMRGSGNTIASLSDLQIGSELTNDYSIIFTSRTLLTQTIKSLKLDMDYKDLQELITINNPKDTRILQVTVTYTDPKMACDIANSVVANGVKAAEEIDSKEPYMIDKAVVQNDIVSPSKLKNTTMGAIIGMVICMGFVVIRFILNDALQTSQDVEKYLELPVLCTIPESKTSQYDKPSDNERSRRHKKHRRRKDI